MSAHNRPAAAAIQFSITINIIGPHATVTDAGSTSGDVAVGC